MSALRRRLVPTLLLALSACPAVAAGSPRADVHGDPLPPGARGRLGTTRLWHGPAVTRLVFAPDGRTFFSAADDAVVCQWDAATGKLVRTFAHPKNVLGVALSPDGKLMATSAADNAVRLWLVATAQELQKWPREERCEALAFAPDGKTLGLSLRDKENGFVCLWDVTRGQEVRLLPLDAPSREDGDHIVVMWGNGRIQRGNPDEMGVAFSADGRHLAAVFRGQAQLRDLATGKKVRRYHATEGPRSLRSLAFAPDGQSLVAASDNGFVHRWEVASVEALPPLRGPNGKDFAAAAFSADGKVYAAVTRDGDLRAWQPATGKLLHESHTDKQEYRAVAVSPDGKALAYGGADGVIRVWDLGAGKERVLAGPRPEFLALTFTRDGSALVSASLSGARRWDAVTGRQTAQAEFGAADAADLGLAAGGQVLALTHADGKVTLHDPATGLVLRALEGARGKDGRVLFSPDGRTLALTGPDEGRTICLYDVGTGREVRSFTGRSDPGEPLAFAPDGRTLVSGDVRPAVWELATGRLRRRLGPAPEEPRDEAYDNLLRLVRNADRSPPARAEAALAVSPDGKRLAAGQGLSVALIHLGTGQVIGRCEGHTGVVGAAAFSPDGKLLATGAGDRTVRLWDAATGKEIGPLTGHRAAVLRVVFSPDGRTLASAGEDHTALLWDVAEAIEVARTRRAGEADARALEEWWAELANEDAAAAGKAIQGFVTRSEVAVSFLKGRLAPAAPVEPAVLARLIADLDGGEFEARERAYKELEKLGDRAEAALRQALADQPSAELRRRGSQLLDGIERRHLTAEQLRALRALEALEQIGTPAAREVLEGLARGAADDRQTREAKAALERLANAGGTP
jgi:WD40 repeat protein